MKTKPKFESNADATLDRVRATYSQRGGEYSDTYATCRYYKMRSVAKELGYEISDAHFRALSVAGLCDMKDERLSGGWKEDSMIDGIAYDAFLVEEMRLLKAPAIMRTPDGMGGADKWRMLNMGEPLKSGDEYHDGGAWRETNHIGIAASCGNAYRRLVS